MNNFELLLAKKLSGDGAAPTLITKNISANGTYTASDDSADGYSSVSVDVPNSYTAQDEGKVVNSGSLVAQTSTTATTNGTIDTTTNNEVVVNVPNSYTQSDEGKVVQSGSLVAQTSTSISNNAFYNCYSLATITINKPSGSINGSPWGASTSSPTYTQIVWTG